jgi:hypothetical protein
MGFIFMKVLRCIMSRFLVKKEPYFHKLVILIHNSFHFFSTLQKKKVTLKESTKLLTSCFEIVLKLL